jgi:hypothetical protein
MARAFIASVPMGIVLVAALVVPLAVIPGTFGFDRWPSSRGEQVTERQVRLAPPKVDVVAVRPRRAVPERHPVVVSTAPRPAPAVVALAPAPRRTTVVHVQSPKPDRVPRPSHPTQAQPAPQPQPQPQQPAPQPSKGDSGLLAGRHAPVAREVPQQEAPAPAPQPPPQPAPQPVQQPAPQPAPRIEAPQPCHGRGEGGGQQGDDNSQQ